MSGTSTDDFEVSLDGEKRVVVEPDTHISEFGSLYQCFDNNILAHIPAITLIPKKGSFSNISTRDVFALYFLLKKYRINLQNGSRRICGKVLKT